MDDFRHHVDPNDPKRRNFPSLLRSICLLVGYKLPRSSRQRFHTQRGSRAVSRTFSHIPRRFGFVFPSHPQTHALGKDIVGTIHFHHHARIDQRNYPKRSAMESIGHHAQRWRGSSPNKTLGRSNGEQQRLEIKQPTTRNHDTWWSKDGRKE